MKRNPAVDGLRCLLMFFIVAYHCFTRGQYSCCGDLWTILYVGLTIWHVDAFIALTGWFGCRFSFSKILKLWGVVIWYQLLSLAGTGSVGNQAGGWYVSTFVFFIFLSPFVNAGVDALHARYKHKSFLFWLIVVVGFVAFWILGNHHLVPFDVKMDYLFLFLFIYVTVRLVRKCNLEGCIVARKWQIGIACLSCMLMCGVMTIVYRHLVGMPNCPRMIAGLSNYYAPHIWGFAVLVVIVVGSAKNMPQWCGRAFTFAAPSMLGVYLMHNTTGFSISFCVEAQKWVSAHTGAHPALVVFCGSLIVYMGCLLATWSAARCLDRLFVLWIHMSVKLMLGFWPIWSPVRRAFPGNENSL